MPPGRGEIIRREYVRSKELLPNVNHLLFPQNLALHFLLKQLTSQHGKHNCGHRLTGPQCPREQCDLGQHTQPLGIQPRVKQRGWHSSKVIKSLKYMKKNLKIQKKAQCSHLSITHANKPQGRLVIVMHPNGAPGFWECASVSATNHILHSWMLWLPSKASSLHKDSLEFSTSPGKWWD